MIHVQTWSGSCTARITDMANAGKRGKTCRVLRFSGCPWPSGTGNDLQQRGRQATADILQAIEGFTPDRDFDMVAALLQAAIQKARNDGIPESHVAAYPEELKGIHAPVPRLTASGEGWSASADESGISVNDDADAYNMPCMITPSGQTNNQSYKLAAKVWEQVKAATSFHDVGDILRAAGCKLHYYCRMD